MHRRTFLLQSAALGALVAGRGVSHAMSRHRLRVVQLGTAHAHASEKWATLRRLSEEFEPVGIWEPDAALRRKAEGEPEYAGARWLSEQELFATPDVDGALIECELPDLLTQAQRAVAAGWHVHLDKPGAFDLAKFSALQDRCARDRRVLQSGYMFRYHPAVRFCLEAQRQGWLGEIHAIHGEIGKVIGAGRRPWLAEHYGGSMMLLGCHLLDLTLALLGSPTAITAQRRASSKRDSFRDHEVALLSYPRAIATIRSLLTEVEGDARRQFVIAAENATIEILPLEPARARVAFKNPPAGFVAGYQELKLEAISGRYDTQLQEFAQRIRAREIAFAAPFDAAHERRLLALLLEHFGPRLAPN